MKDKKEKEKTFPFVINGLCVVGKRNKTEQLSDRD